MFVFICICTFATPAWAHDALASTDPAASQTVPRVPSAVALTFEEPPLTMGLQVVVTGPDGPVQQGAPRLADDVVTQALRGDAPKGTYTVDWRVTADDGHPVSGSFTFTALAAGAAAATGTDAAPASPSGSSGAILLVVGLAVVASVASLVWHRYRGRRGDRAPIATISAR